MFVKGKESRFSAASAVLCTRNHEHRIITQKVRKWRSVYVNLCYDGMSHKAMAMFNLLTIYFRYCLSILQYSIRYPPSDIPAVENSTDSRGRRRRNFVGAAVTRRLTRPENSSYRRNLHASILSAWIWLSTTATDDTPCCQGNYGYISSQKDWLIVSI